MEIFYEKMRILDQVSLSCYVGGLFNSGFEGGLLNNEIYMVCIFYRKPILKQCRFLCL